MKIQVSLLIACLAAAILAASAPAGALEAGKPCGYYIFRNTTGSTVTILRDNHPLRSIENNTSAEAFFRPGTPFQAVNDDTGEVLWDLNGCDPDAPDLGNPDGFVQLGNDSPGVDCSVNIHNKSALITVLSFNLAPNTKVPLNLSRVDESGDEIFVFLGTQRTGEDLIYADGGGSAYMSVTSFEISVADIEPGEFEFFARYKLSSSDKGPRVSCGSEAVGVQRSIPDGVLGSVPLSEDPSSCWAVDYDANGDGVADETMVSLTGYQGFSRNLRGDGKWLQKMPASEAFTDPSVDQVIIRGGGEKRTIDCQRGWTGNAALETASEFSTVYVSASAFSQHGDNSYVFWRQNRSTDGCHFAECDAITYFVTNLTTGDVLDLGSLSAVDRYRPYLRDCTGRFLGIDRRATVTGDGDVFLIFDLSTSKFVLSADQGFDQSFFDGGFECESNSFWYFPDDDALGVQFFLPTS